MSMALNVSTVFSIIMIEEIVSCQGFTADEGRSYLGYLNCEAMNPFSKP